MLVEISFPDAAHRVLAICMRAADIGQSKS
jgi:hypothetical protein